MQSRHGRILSRIAAAAVAGIGLVVIYQIYVSGNPALAAAFTGGFGLAFFVYTSRRTYTYRYLFPGLAAIAMFIVLPLVYTVWLGFTNYSSRNLLTFERATEVILGELDQSDAGETARYQFTLHAAPGGFRLVLRAGEDEAPPADSTGGSETSILDDVAPVTGSAGSGSAGSGSAGSGSAAAGSAGSGSAALPARPASVFVTGVLPLTQLSAQRVEVAPLAGSGFAPGDPLPLKAIAEHRDAIKAITVQLPDGTAAAMTSLSEFALYRPLYQQDPDGTITSRKTGERLTPNFHTGFYETPSGTPVSPGFRVNVGLGNYVRTFTDSKFRGPFVRVFLWTVVFATLTVVFTAGLGMLLAELLSWERLRFAGLYRVLLFLPYAVPGFISILVFKGLFNRNFGEINLILDSLLGIRPNWSGNALLARAMILIVNTWLGYPYFMLICMGLQKSIPHDLYEASALAGAGPLTNFFQITWPLIRKPLTPLLVSAFAYNFNNFVLIYLLTAGRPDFLDTNVPAGETDILVSYTYRIAFQDSGQNFGLAAAISTIVFLVVAILSVINLQLTRTNAPDKR
ncbi:MAG TPA: maltose ABC transporter permease MalF [Kofleriaceae bacterium]